MSSAEPAASPAGRSTPLFVLRDLDGFFGLGANLLVVLLLIAGLCKSVVHLPDDLIFGRILPAAGLAVLAGNLFHALAAVFVSRSRPDVTALPFGINTIGLFIQIFFVMQPEYLAKLQVNGDTDAGRRAAVEAAWTLGCLSCVGAAAVELLGSLLLAVIAGVRSGMGDKAAERTERFLLPRGPILASLGGIAIGFVAMTFAVDIWSHPMVAFLPFAVLLVTYLSRVRLPLGIPGELLALAVGAGLAWGQGLMGVDAVTASYAEVGFRRPNWWAETILGAVQPEDLLRAAAVFVPLGLYNLVGNIQNIEDAAQAGDRYPVAGGVIVNSLITAGTGLLGSPFPTTVYIGHGTWKGLGSRIGYGAMAGAVAAVLALTGSVAVIGHIIPVQAAYPVMLFVGAAITGQAFGSFPARHAPAAALALVPALAAWGFVLVRGTLLTTAGFINPEPEAPAPVSGATAAAKAPAPPATPGIPEAPGMGDKPATPEAPATDEGLETPVRVSRDGISIGQLVVAEQHRPGGGRVSGYLVHGLLVLERGFIFTSIFLAAIAANLIDRRFLGAAFWSLLAAGLTWVGLMHAYAVLIVKGPDGKEQYGNAVDHVFANLGFLDKSLAIPPGGDTANIFRAQELIAGYLMFAAVFLVLGVLRTGGRLEMLQTQTSDAENSAATRVL
jgi:AGZA family xanthine/uracil permease-like MFS transporter